MSQSLVLLRRCTRFEPSVAQGCWLIGLARSNLLQRGCGDPIEEARGTHHGDLRRGAILPRTTNMKRKPSASAKNLLVHKDVWRATPHTLTLTGAGTRPKLRGPIASPRSLAAAGDQSSAGSPHELRAEL
jgi:hypothetical protein